MSLNNFQPLYVPALGYLSSSFILILLKRILVWKTRMRGVLTVCREPIYVSILCAVKSFLLKSEDCGNSCVSFPPPHIVAKRSLLLSGELYQISWHSLRLREMIAARWRGQLAKKPPPQHDEAEWVREDMRERWRRAKGESLGRTEEWFMGGKTLPLYTAAAAEDYIASYSQSNLNKFRVESIQHNILSDVFFFFLWLTIIIFKVSKMV